MLKLRVSLMLVKLNDRARQTIFYSCPRKDCPNHERTFTETEVIERSLLDPAAGGRFLCPSEVCVSDFFDLDTSVACDRGALRWKAGSDESPKAPSVVELAPGSPWSTVLGKRVYNEGMVELHLVIDKEHAVPKATHPGAPSASSSSSSATAAKWDSTSLVVGVVPASLDTKKATAAGGVHLGVGVGPGLCYAGWGVKGPSAKKQQYGKKFEPGARVSIQIDFGRGRIAFGYNGENLNRAFAGIKGPLRLAVSGRGEHTVEVEPVPTASVSEGMQRTELVVTDGTMTAHAVSNRKTQAKLNEQMQPLIQLRKMVEQRMREDLEELERVRRENEELMSDDEGGGGGGYDRSTRRRTGRRGGNSSVSAAINVEIADSSSASAEMAAKMELEEAKSERLPWLERNARVARENTDEDDERRLAKKRKRQQLQKELLQQNRDKADVERREREELERITKQRRVVKDEHEAAFVQACTAAAVANGAVAIVLDDDEEDGDGDDDPTWTVNGRQVPASELTEADLQSMDQGEYERYNSWVSSRVDDDLFEDDDELMD